MKVEFKGAEMVLPDDYAKAKGYPPGASVSNYELDEIFADFKRGKISEIEIKHG